MLRTRLVLAAVILVPLFLLIYADLRWNFGAPGVWLFPCALGIVLLATAELHSLWAAAMGGPSRRASLLAIGLASGSMGLPVYWPLTGAPYPPTCPLGGMGWTIIGCLAALALWFAHEMWSYRRPTGTVVPRLGFLAFGLAYLVLPLSFLVALRRLENNGWGMLAFLSVIVVVKCSDTGAYLVGMMLGRRPMAPVLSPRKTIEGAVGGLVAGMLAALFCGIVMPPLLIPGVKPGPEWLRWSAFGLAVSLAGMIGDLAESLIKRDADRKDSSDWLPGLGGTLDVVDSVLFAAPVAYLFWLNGCLGSPP